MRSMARPPRSARVSARWALTMRRRCARRRRPLDKRRARLWRGQDAALSVRALRAPLGVADVARRQRAGVERTLRRDPGSRRGRGRTDAAARVGVTDPVGYWLVTLARHTPLQDVVATAKWWVEQNYRELKQEVGDFEGRGWRGFHHHLTLSFAAYGFLVMRRCQQPWPAGGRAGVLSFPVVADPTHPPIRPERHAPTSIPTMRRRLTVGLARRLPRCPCCQTPHSEQVLLIQPLLLSA